MFLSSARPRTTRYEVPSNLNHLVHALLTLGTFGFWLPVWLVQCLRHEGWKSRFNWTLAGHSSSGMHRIDRMDLSPETRRMLNAR